jgi:RNA polymerase sigma-70 factor (ECF subfamily)
LTETTLEREKKSRKRFGDISESELVDMLKAGDDKAWKILYDGFYAYIFQLVKCKNYRITDQDAEDICSEVFEDLIKGIKNFKKQSILKTYIHSMTINRIRQHYRKLLTIKRGSGVEDLSLDEIPVDIPDSKRFSPESIIIENSEMQTLREHVAKLPEVARNALTLRYLKNMKYKEIAEYLDIPEGSVGALIQKSLLTLKRIMSEETNRTAA